MSDDTPVHGAAAGALPSPAPAAAAAASASASSSAAAAAPAALDSVVSAGGAGIVIPKPSELLNSQIKRLKEEQAAMRAAKKALVKTLKNCQKRRSRLKKRARQLTDADLVEVLRMRQQAMEEDGEGRGAADAVPPLPPPEEEAE